ncbi:hypothetical protein MAR_037581 [Mya arenaria]|uniref:Uncharacterized protein n=1 Tax=Mya arenaria TaxID=6604 RepID=A0ABY7FQN6_MYAAR|nr:hypothetical protein MAR_037581 [Mya arenaria]
MDCGLNMDIRNSDKTSFVGRTNYFTELNSAWIDYKVFGIYGLKAIGKSSYFKHFLKFKRGEAHFFDLTTKQTIRSLYISICSSFAEKPDELAICCSNNYWIEHILDIIQEVPKDVTIVFDNAEDVIDGPLVEKFLRLCTTLIEHSKAKIVITSTTKVIFTKHSNIYFTQEILPLTPDESKILFSVAAPDVDLGSYRDTIVELSEGLPLLILLIASELEADGGHVSPEEMVGLLLECRLQTISNSHAHTRVDVGTEAKTKQFALKPIRDRHMLRYESDSRRFNIQGILREVITTNFVIKNLADIADKMGTSEYTKAIAEFSMEQPNLRKLLWEVDDTKQDTYHFFIEIASSCTELIEKYMADQSDAFYGGCLELADKYGKDKDKVSVYIAVGSVETLTKGNLQVGEKNFLKALRVLKKYEDKHQMAVVYKKLGWIAFKQGFCARAVERVRLSREIPQLLPKATRTTVR